MKHLNGNIHCPRIAGHCVAVYALAIQARSGLRHREHRERILPGVERFDEVLQASDYDALTSDGDGITLDSDNTDNLWTIFYLGGRNVSWPNKNGS